MTKEEFHERFIAKFVEMAKRAAETELAEGDFDVEHDNPEDCAEEAMEASADL